MLETVTPEGCAVRISKEHTLIEYELYLKSYCSISELVAELLQEQNVVGQSV